MNENDRPVTIRRILVALDSSPYGAAALRSAAALAAALEAELLGVFVEDIDLLHLAEAPFASEISYGSATGLPLDRISMESKLRAMSAQCEKALALAGEQFRVPWTFRTARGRMLAELQAAATETDLLALGGLGSMLGSPASVTATILKVTARPVPFLLIPEGGVKPRLRILVSYDGSRDARRRLFAAAQLARSEQTGISIVLAATGPEHAEKMQDEIQAVLAEQNQKARYLRVNPNDDEGLLRALKSEQPCLLVLGRHELTKKLPALEPVMQQTGTPLLVFGDGEEL